MFVKRITAAIIASVGLASLPSTCPTASAAASENQSGGASDFTVFWSVAMFGDVADGAGGRHWQDEIDFEGAAISRDLIFLAQFKVGAFPRPGIHVLELEPERWDRHWSKLANDLDRYVPEDFTGIVVIDYERWRPAWERTRNIRNDQAPYLAEDHDYLLDWRDAIRETRRDEYYSHSRETRLQYVYDTYDEMSLRFYLETLRECKRLRPNAKWTYFNFPKMLYYSPETPDGVIGYGDLSHNASRINDKLQALYDEMDVIVPSIYPQKWTVVGNNWVPWLPLRYQNRTQGNEAFISSNVAEARRLANGKPVYPIISLRYYMRWPELYWLNDLNIRMAITVSRDAGADGLILWDGIRTREEWYALQEMISDRLAPAVRELVGTTGPENGGHNTAGGNAGNQDKTTVISGVLTVGGN
ncbi:MAG: hypothetical protein D6695_04535 [Planctomycetota bacterium]|nr:MAG: hypothetical protein D6695_04535 [Planctomycetota bacterium]